MFSFLFSSGKPPAALAQVLTSINTVSLPALPLPPSLHFRFASHLNTHLHTTHPSTMSPSPPSPSSAPALTPLDILWHLIDPFLFIALSASYLPLTILALIRTQQFSTLASPARFKDAWFARFWGEVGPQTRENALPRVGPMIKEARGVVLDSRFFIFLFLPCFKSIA